MVIFDPRPKAGGLNEYGIATYKSVDNFAAREVDWLLQIGGITVETGKSLGEGMTLSDLTSEFDAVFLGIGLGGVNALRCDGEDKDGVLDAVDFIADLRQASEFGSVAIGRDVVVIGGGMTAVDAAVQAKLLGALNVSLVYRRGKDRMNASEFEQDLAASKGVRIITNASPRAVIGNGSVREIEFEYTDDDLAPTGETFRLTADQVFKAIGQTLFGDDLPDIDRGKITVSEAGAPACQASGPEATVPLVAKTSP